MLFASDLDNTIIHSYKKFIVGDICVEKKDGKELSYVSDEVFALLKLVKNKCEFVPVTTRSIEQYNRIDFGFVPKYAIVAHGAFLIVDGKLDDDWTTETRNLLNITLPSLKPNDLITDIRYVDDFFIFAKSDEPDKAVLYLESIIQDQNFLICAVHNKVYVMPKKLQKSDAVNRLKNKLAKQFVICAGDSTLDISMLEIADVAIHPQNLNITNPNKITLCENDFSRNALKIADNILCEKK